MDRVIEAIGGPPKQVENKMSLVNTQITLLHNFRINLYQKAMGILDSIDPSWRTKDADIVDYIKDELTGQMTCVYNMESWKALSADNEYNGTRRLTIEHIADTVKTLDAADPEWKATMPKMVEKMKFDLKGGIGMAVY